MLSVSLIQRMRLDLITYLDKVDEKNMVEEHGQTDGQQTDKAFFPQWIAHPRSLRLSTRSRLPIKPDETRSRNISRISKSALMPSFVFTYASSLESLAQRLVDEALMPLFRRLHPEKIGWNLSLVNICATSMEMTASNGSTGVGRDIGQMFRKQDTTLKIWRIADIDVPPESKYHSNEVATHNLSRLETTTASEPARIGHEGSEDVLPLTQSSLYEQESWIGGEDDGDFTESCIVCGAIMPIFAVAAHERFHEAHD